MTLKTLDLRRTLEGYAQSRREQDLLHKEVADRERAFQKNRIGGIHEMEALKRTQEMHVDEFSRVKLIEHQNIINENESIYRQRAHDQGAGITI